MASRLKFSEAPQEQFLKLSCDADSKRKINFEVFESKIFPEIHLIPYEEVFKYLNTFYQSSETFQNYWDTAEKCFLNADFTYQDQVVKEIQWLWLIKNYNRDIFTKINPEINNENFRSIFEKTMTIIGNPMYEPYFYLLIYMRNIKHLYSRHFKCHSKESLPLQTFNQLHTSIIEELYKNAGIDFRFAMPFGVSLSKLDIFFDAFFGGISVEKLRFFINEIKQHETNLLHIFYIMTTLKSLCFSKNSSILFSDFFSNLQNFSYIYRNRKFLSWYKANRLERLFSPHGITSKTKSSKRLELTTIYLKKQKRFLTSLMQSRSISDKYKIFFDNVNLVNFKDLFTLMSEKSLLQFFDICIMNSISDENDIIISTIHNLMNPRTICQLDSKLKDSSISTREILDKYLIYRPRINLLYWNNAEEL